MGRQGSAVKSSAARLNNHERVLQAVELRKAGMSFQAIADRLGWKTRNAAFMAIQKYIASTTYEAVEALRAVEAERLDAMQLQYWPQAIQGDVDSAELVLKIMARRAKMFGLDAPQRTELSGSLEITNTDTTPAALITARIDELAAKRDERRMIDTEATG